MKALFVCLFVGDLVCQFDRPREVDRIRGFVCISKNKQRSQLNQIQLKNEPEKRQAPTTTATTIVMNDGLDPPHTSKTNNKLPYETTDKYQLMYFGGGTEPIIDRFDVFGPPCAWMATTTTTGVGGMYYWCGRDVT